MITREYFDKYINVIEIPKKDKQYSSIADLFSSDKPHTGTISERIEDLQQQLKRELTIAYDRIESMAGYEARTLWDNLQLVFNLDSVRKEILERKLTEYDNGETSKNQILDFLTLELNV